VSEETGLIEAMAREMYRKFWELNEDVPEWDKSPYQTMWRDQARAALSAISAAGWAVVPKQPTPEMDEAGYQAMLHWPEEWHLGPPEGITSEWFQSRQAYQWMLAAAPKVPSP